jgi:hypothetical protein
MTDGTLLDWLDWSDDPKVVGACSAGAGRVGSGGTFIGASAVLGTVMSGDELATMCVAG